MVAVLPFIFGNWFIAAVMSVVITAAFYMGVAYLGGKLFGPDMPEADVGPTANAQSRSWNPRSTQQEGIARPRAWGKNLHHGNIVAKWTDVDGNAREILYMIVEHGDGPTKGVVEVDGVKQVFLNDQPATNFGSVTIQERLGTLNQTCMTGFEKLKLGYPQNTMLEKDEPIIVTTPNDYFDDIEYTLLWPNGLRKYHKSGGMDYSACTVKVRIREHPAGGWTEIFNAATTVRQNEPLFILHKVNTLSPGYVVRGKQYDLEFTNLTGPSERHVNDVSIRSIREVVDIAFTRPGKALVGITAIATTALSGSIDVKVIREDKLIRVYNGTTWSIVYSRNRAWVVWNILTQPVISGDGNGGGPFTVESYEGFDPSYLDLEFFYNWAEFCSTQIPDGYGGTEDRVACDTILDFHTSVWEFANEIANIGRARLYWSDTLTGWIDTTVAAVSGLVTMDNIMARTWKNAWSEKDELAGKVEVFFNDSRQGYERTHAALPNESAGRYTRIISIEGVGIITRGTAIHMANHALKRNQLIRNVNGFRQYKDGFRYKPGNTINIQHKVPNWGEGYRVVKSTAANKVTLDRVCTAEVDDLLFIQVYNTVSKQVEVDSYTVFAVSGKVVTIVGTWDVTPVKNYMVATGADGDIQTRRIVKMDLRSDNYFDIEVETYDTTLFTADDLVPDLPDQNYIWSKPANPLQRPVTYQEVIDLIGQLAIPQLDVDAPQTSNLTWSGNSVDTVSWGKTDATEVIQFRYKGITYAITPDSTTDEFIYWDPNFTTTFRTTNDAAVAVTVGKWYMCRNVAGVAYPTVPFSSVHAGVLQAGTITAALGQLANAVVTTAKIKDLAVETLKIKDEAVTVPASVAGISLAFTTTGTSLFINASGLIKLEQSYADAWRRWRFSMTVKRDAVVIYSSGEMRKYTYLNDQIVHIPWACGVTDNPGVGTYTYTIEFGVSENWGSATFQTPNLFIIETKK